MGSVRARKDTGLLFIDFYYRSIRCREQTALEDTPANRKKVQKLLDRIEGEISLGTFDYQRYFPSSRNMARFKLSPMASAVQALGSAVSGNGSAQPAIAAQTPLFKEFAETWFNEKSVEWRESYRQGVRANLDKGLIPRFGEMAVGQITKANILAFRAELAKVQARGKQTVLSNPRINKMLNPLRMILNEAADRFNFPTPFQNIKQLKVRKTDVQPFSLDEVQRILSTVRPDFHNYFKTRFFTGMRTGEIHGLKWKFVDFERRLILVRETVIDGRTEYTKTDGSQRDIRLVRGSLASIRWLGRPVCCDGYIRISRLVLLERPEAAANLFSLVPRSWVSDRELVVRASALWEGLPRGFRHLFNAMFWDGRRFQRYLMGPSSLGHHHSGLNGNFRHCVEVAERALRMADGQALANRAILAFGGLVHDAGKADEYRFDHARRCFSMSDRGALIGHRETLQQWIAAAMASYRVILPEAHYLGLIHALTAAKGAPAWLGLREPRSLEATILSMADRLSGEEELYARLASAEGGFGRYHKQLKYRPFVVGLGQEHF